MEKKQKRRKEKGITLVALVVTIIVLLILAGVSIATLTGENGILTQANRAKEEMKAEEDKEKIKLAISEAQIGNSGYQELDANNLQEAIDKQFNGRNVVVSDNEDGTFTVSCLDTLKEYIVSSNGVEDGINYNEYFDRATAQIIDGKTIYAIDKSGNNVNMNNWEFCYDIQTNGYALNDEEVLNNSEYGGTNETRVRNAGYKGGYDAETGEITEKVPMYIKEDNGEWKPVTSMYNTFYGCINLEKAPEIPNTIKCMWSTYQSCSNLSEGKVGNGTINLRNCFTYCTNLNSTPYLTNKIENLQVAFQGCTSLTKITNIPYSVTNMNSTFYGCTNLVNVDVNIPDSVIDMSYTFYECNNLESVFNIGNNVKLMVGTFYNCNNLVNAPNLPKTVEIIRSTFNGCENLVSPPKEIPSSVINMSYAFINCKKLEGTLEINTNPSDYDKCFSEVAITGKGLNIKTANELLKENDYAMLKEIVNTKSSESNIKILY